jgi:peptide/nickel transport system substrate-binding protein
MALDREGLARGVFAGLGEVISGPFDPRSPCYDQAIQPLPFDLDAAARLLDEAGFTNNDGVRSRGAVRLAFDLHIWAGSSDWEAVGEIWRGALAPLSVAVRVIPVASPAMQEVLDGRRFDTFAGSWAPDPEIELRQQWHSAESAGANRVGLRDDEVDLLIADSETGGPEARLRACRALHARLHDLQPMLFVYARQRVPVLHRRGLGLTFPAAEPVRDARRWAWTEEPG